MNTEAKRRYDETLKNIPKNTLVIPKIRQNIMNVLNKDCLKKLILFLIVSEQAKLGDPGSLKIMNDLKELNEMVENQMIEYEYNACNIF